MKCRGLVIATICTLPTLGGCYKFSTPSTVVRSLYEDCNHSEYPKARTLFASHLRDVVDADTVDINAGGTKGVCDMLTHGNSMSSVRIVSEQVDGDRALVLANVEYEDGSTKNSARSLLIREDGAWKFKQ